MYDVHQWTSINIWDHYEQLRHTKVQTGIFLVDRRCPVYKAATLKVSQNGEEEEEDETETDAGGDCT